MIDENPPAWIAPYLGAGFAEDGEGPDAFDCYGLVRAVLRDRWGAEVPSLQGLAGETTAARRAAAAAGPWRRVEPAELRPGDVLEFVLDQLHVGVVVSPAWMLHARRGPGVEAARFRRGPWWPALSGVFRHEALRV